MWRGLAYWKAPSEGGKPVVQVGYGFMSLLQKDPNWARFEMLRTLSGGIAPCRFENTPNALAWNSSLSCLGKPEVKRCSEGVSQDTSWILSTAVASTLQPLACRFESLDPAKVEKCFLSSSSTQRGLAGKKSAKTSRKGVSQ